MNINKQMSTKQSIIFIIVITIALFFAMQVVNHFVNGQSVEDMQRHANKQQELRAEYLQYLVKHNVTLMYNDTKETGN